MRLRAFSALGVVASLVVGGGLTFTAATHAPATATPADPVVALIDTGVRATHQEFTYGGASSTTDQFVGWWDFSADTSNHLPTLGQTWDTTFADPFDTVGHGTATAGIAVGKNVVPSGTKFPSFCPGCKLAEAKVADAGGSISGNIAEAFKWARESVHADIISMSIGEIAPLPAFISSDVFREIRLARQAGILVTISNGNGFANAGIPGEPGFASAYGNSPYALGVGAIGIDGELVTTDPEVVAKFANVALAANNCDTCYQNESGTSFSNPLVAGFAADLLKTAAANGCAADADYLEKLVKYSARDTAIPPTFEGYGIIDAAQQPAARANAAACTLPARPNPDVNAAYVETVQGTLDTVWTDKLSEGAQAIVRSNLGTTTPLGTIGTSAPTGVSEAEVYSVSANRGDVVTADLTFLPPDPNGVNDIDLYVIWKDPTSNITAPTGSTLVAKSNNAAGVTEHIQFVAPKTGDYYVIPLGWSVAGSQAFSLTSNKTLDYVYQDYVLHTFGSGLFL